MQKIQSLSIVSLEVGNNQRVSYCAKEYRSQHIYDRLKSKVLTQKFKSENSKK
jgi:hypothetical protein